MNKISPDELAVRSSIQLFLATEHNPKPQDFGSGCILTYQGRFFLFTVSHVVSQQDLILYLETNLPSDETGTPLKQIGGIITFDMFGLKKKRPITGIDDLLQNGKTIDLAFAEISEAITLLQPPLDFGAFKVEASQKIALSLDDAVQPRQKERYAFFGKIKPGYLYNDNGPLPFLSLTNTFKFNLEYSGKKGGHYEFLTPEIITDEREYKGFSGAPILDSKGRIVALVVAVLIPSRIVQGLPIQECKKYLDFALRAKIL